MEAIRCHVHDEMSDATVKDDLTLLSLPPFKYIRMEYTINGFFYE